MPKIAPFEKFSDEYDRWFDEHPDLYEVELAVIRRLLPPAGAIGLEVGVGSGKFAVPLGVKIGVEPSAAMAGKARSQGIDVHPGVAEKLPFADGLFDFVLMVTTICFVDDVTASCREAWRVLKAGGSIIVGFVDRESELGRHYSEKKESSRFYREATFFSVAEVRQCLEKAGFVVTKGLQALIPGKKPETIWAGSGKGAFVAIKGRKMMVDGAGSDASSEMG
jgi:SAM-dependent methyltransferase